MMDKKQENKTLYYPRKMRAGWCVAHEITVSGVTIEKYGIHCPTYAEAFRRAEAMNEKQQPRNEQPENVGDSPKQTKGGGEL